MALATVETPGPTREEAAVLDCIITEALCRLEGLYPHPSRTRLGRHLLAAHEIAQEWMRDGYGGEHEGPIYRP